MNVVEAERTHTEELAELERPPRPEKVAEVERLAGLIKEARGIYLTDFRGINVERMNQLRGMFRAEGVQYRIVKNNLLKLAADEAGLPDWVSDLEGPTALAVGVDDPVAPAKVIKSFQDEHRREADYLGFKGGLLAGEPIDETIFQRLATLPGRTELIAKLLYLLTYPMRGLVTVLSAVPRGLVYALEDYRKQRVAGGEVPEEADSGAEGEPTSEVAEGEAEELKEAEAEGDTAEAEGEAQAEGDSGVAEGETAEETEEAEAAATPTEKSEADADAGVAEGAAEAEPENEAEASADGGQPASADDKGADGSESASAGAED
jgi:large subunit ribosomal protein L10